MGSSTFPYPPGFLRRLSLLIPFKYKIHHLEGGKNGSKVEESPEKTRSTWTMPCGLKDKLQNQLRHKRQPEVLIMVLAQYSTIWAALFPSNQQFSTIHVQFKRFLKRGFHLWYHPMSYSWFG